MHDSTRPFLVIYVAWHPSFADGERLARVLYDHYRRKLYENVAGGAGLPVVYRSLPAPDVAVRRQGFWDNRRRELTEALVHQVCHIRPLHLDEASGAV